MQGILGKIMEFGGMTKKKPSRQKKFPR